jgi:hypothetical protein
MPELSQRTLGKVITALTAVLPGEADTFPLMRDFWRAKLFEWGFPPWLIDFVLARSMNWSAIIPELFEGTVRTKDHVSVGYALCHQMLRKLTALAFDESKNRSTQERIRLSLQLDGFDVSKQELKPIDGPVSVEEEKSRLLDNLKASNLGRQDVISKHIEDAEDLFNEGRHHAAIGEARSALQAVIEEAAILLESKIPRRSGGGTKNKIEFLEREGFLSSDEQQSFLSAWGFLSSGNHPGLSSEEEGRIGTILCLEFIQILLIKCKSLLQTTS